MDGLDLVPIYMAGYEDLLVRLSQRLETVFDTNVRVNPVGFDPEGAFDSSRGQYNSTVLLRMLLDGPSDPTRRVLGVTSVDLYIPVLTYVFGEAQLDGRAAVVSLQRLRSEVYGLPPDAELLASRLEKEAVHELGHTHGLLHCTEPSCVMHASTYVDEIDVKTSEFCEYCRGTARQPDDPELRRAKLEQFDDALADLQNSGRRTRMHVRRGFLPRRRGDDED